MSYPIITADKLSKRYTISHQQGYDTLRDKITEAASRPFRLFTKKARTNREEFWALRDISFSVQQGERVGIIGRNGAGKSTLLKVLSQITFPTKGVVTLRGRVASLLEVGTGFHPELTGRENIFLNGAILGMKQYEIRKKFDEIVAFAEIDKFLDTPVKRYSSGMYVRLAFAVAAHLEPEILIVDEVLAVGDIQFQKKCLGKMESVANEGRTILFVSHNLTAVRSLCKRVLLLDAGKCIADGQPDQIIHRYIGEMSEPVLSRTWTETDAPRNGSATLREISIVDTSGKPMREVYTDDEFAIQIRYRVHAENATLGLTVLVYDENNSCVFGSINNQEQNWYGKNMPQGEYMSTCLLPANFLNNGAFRIGVNMFGRNFSDLKSLSDVLTLDVLDGSSVRGDFYGDFAGVVRPLLKWITESK